ncbi:MAG: hypothetical protein ACRD28_11480 [Acidobacteriaceae bacterium]
MILSACMSTKVGRYALIAAALILLNLFATRDMLAASALSNPGPSQMTLSQVVGNMIARNAERARDLTGYRNRRIYTVAYHGFPKNLNATMVVDMQYRAPDTKKFKVVSESGPKWMIERVLKRLVKSETDAQTQKTREGINLNRENYNFSNLEYQPAANGCSYVVSVAPKKPSKYLYRGKIWINDKDFAVCRIEAQPAKNPSFWIASTAIVQTYEKHGEFWLPEKNKSVSRIRFGGSATLTIQYTDYTITSRQTPDAGNDVSSASAAAR